MSGRVARCASAAALGLSGLASAQLIPSYGHDFVTVGAVGNAPYDAHPVPWFPPPLAHNRGSVGYQYRISRTEIVTSQWIEFVNSFSVKGPAWQGFGDAFYRGAEIDPTYQGTGRRWRLRDTPQAEQFPVYGITWREAAQYANWLHNDRVPEEWAIADGAYDTSTFVPNPAGGVMDQKTHHPGARFWIPTLDEMLKAQHYDPDRFGPGQGGWWEYSNSSDVAPVGGLPGVGEANTGFTLPNFGHYDIPAGSYPEFQTPWGLLDAAGGAQEWTEEFYIQSPATERATKGSWAGGAPVGPEVLDRAWGLSSFLPSIRDGVIGLRIASAVPPPSTLTLVAFMYAGLTFTRPCRKETVQ